MQELDPSPVDDNPPDIETGDYFPEPTSTAAGQPRSFGISRIGLKPHSWDYWREFIQPSVLKDLCLAYAIWQTNGCVATYSFGGSTILDVSAYGLLCVTCRQYFTHPSCHALTSLKRLVPAAHATNLSIPLSRTCHGSTAHRRTYRLWNRIAQHPGP